MTYFVRVQSGVVIEKGQTDAVAFATMQAASAEYVEVTREQHAALSEGDPAP